MNERTGWQPADKTVNIEADYIARESAGEIERAIGRLNDKQKELVRLRYYEDKPFVEIARLLGVSKSAITQQFATIHKILKKLLSEP